MHASLARYSAPASFVHAPSLADFITTMVGFKVFGTHSLSSGGGDIAGTRFQEGARVGLAGAAGADVGGGHLLNDPPLRHHRDAVAQMGDDREIVADHEISDTALPAQ